MIAWRYLRAKKAEGGVSTMTWISLIGITLAVFALIATLSVRAGFRSEFVGTILGANAHITAYSAPTISESGQQLRGFKDYDEAASRILETPGVTRVTPMIRAQAMVSSQNRTNGAEIYGFPAKDFMALPRIGHESGQGDITRYNQGIALGRVLAQELGVRVGDNIRLISPNGVQTAFGTSPRVKAYEVVYIFSSGRYDIDKTRIYMPFSEAQSYFNREGFADELDIEVAEPENVTAYIDQIIKTSDSKLFLWTWRDASGAFLRALDVEDNIMFIILSILVLIATMNIVSGLIMLVKNKGRDIGILRTMGLSEGAILRIFFMCGATTGIIGTLFGVILGCLFTIYIDPVFSALNALTGNGVWDPSIRGIYALPTKLQWNDVLSAVSLSLGLSFIITLFPARRAARMNPVEALRYE